MKEKIKNLLLKIPKKPVIIIGSAVLAVAIGITVYFTVFYCEHSYRSRIITEANCSEEGVREYTCVKCKKTYTEKIAKNPSRHSYESAVTKEASCTENGEKTYTCTRCKHTYTEPIMGSHNWQNATCIKPKTCSVCGAIDGDKSNTHNFVNGICNLCGKTNYKLQTVAGVTFKLPTEEITVNYLGKETFTFESFNLYYAENFYRNDSNWNISYSGRKIKGNDDMYIDYRVLDSDGYTFSSGLIAVKALNSGAKMKDGIITINIDNAGYKDLEPGKTYTFEIVKK